MRAPAGGAPAPAREQVPAGASPQQTAVAVAVEARGATVKASAIKARRLDKAGKTGESPRTRSKKRTQPRRPRSPRTVTRATAATVRSAMKESRKS